HPPTILKNKKQKSWSLRVHLAQFHSKFQNPQSKTTYATKPKRRNIQRKWKEKTLQQHGKKNYNIPMTNK
ncbi:unnamed protein product, partial [Prunus brigantina]